MAHTARFAALWRSAVRRRPGIDAAIFDLSPWKDDGHGAKQDKAVARQKDANLAATKRWVIEGVSGWLAEVAIPRATALIWLDIPWEVCQEGLLVQHDTASAMLHTGERGEIVAASTSQLALKTAANHCSAGLKPSIEP